MNNTFIKSITEGMIKNLPAILTGVSVVSEVGTVTYSVWAGWKAKEITEDDSIDNKQKVKKIALLSVPTIFGTLLSGGCAIAAHKENGKRFAALTVSGTAGAILMASDETKDKALDLIDKNHKIHRRITNEGVKSNINTDSTEVIDIYDEVTGYKFQTSLSDLWFTVKRFNDEVSQIIGTGETRTIGDFYDYLLGSKYERIPSHELVKFGTDISYEGNYDNAAILSIELGSRLGDDLKPVYTINYDYIE